MFFTLEILCSAIYVSSTGNNRSVNCLDSAVKDYFDLLVVATISK